MTSCQTDVPAPSNRVSRSPVEATRPRPSFWKAIGAIVTLSALAAWWRPTTGITDSGIANLKPLAAANATAPPSGFPQPSLARRHAARIVPAAEATESLQARLAAIEVQDDPEAQTFALTHLAESLMPGEGYRLLDWLAVESSSPAADELSRLVLQHLANTNLNSLERWAGNQPEEPLRIWAFETVALQRCQENTTDALTWAQGLGSSSAEVAAAIQVATGAARDEPIAALGLAARLPVSPARDDCLAYGVAQWAARDPERAAEWANAVPEEAVRARLLARVAIAMADADPVAAARWVATGVSPGPHQANAAAAVAQRWAQQDRSAAQLWVDAFSDLPLRATASEAIRQAVP